MKVSRDGRSLVPYTLAGGSALVAVSIALAAAPMGGPSYTAAQATAGAQVYTANCAACHGAALQGVSAPALSGTAFLNKWADGSKQLADLHALISQQMPLTKPGSLSATQYLNVTAYILSKNGYTAGSTALSASTLKVALAKPTASTAASSAGAAPTAAAGSLPRVLGTAKAASTTAPTDAELLKPDANDWPMYNGSFDGQRYSALNQITTDNASKLMVKCVYQLGEVGAFQVGPVVYQGKMYITTAHGTTALNADTCNKVWQSTYTPKGPEPFNTNRGVALYGGKLFRGTTDGHLIALDAKTGATLWDTWVADSTKGYFLSAAPAAANGLVYMGEAGADWGANGHIYAFDANTGKRVWTFNVIPTGTEPGADTWQKGAEHGGGSLWTTLTLDTASNQLFVSIGNPAPDLNGGMRPGANLYTDSVVVLNGKTGKLDWYAQQIAHDTHDWDTAASPVLYEAGGKKIMTVANKGGWIYFYDRATQKMFAKEETTTHLNADKAVSLTGRRDCPGTLGGVEWNGPALDPSAGLLYVNSVDWCATYKIGETRYVDGSFYFGGTGTFDPAKDGRGWVRAYDAATGKPAWQKKMPTPMISGITPTAGGVLFTGDQNGDFYALNSKDGATLYKFRTGGAIGGGIITYGVNGQQYVAVASGNASRSIWSTTGAATIFVFTVPKE
ncbi:c-type cytochrome [Deinococcus sp. KSM4-11]|uniref:outer membrane protein assembly factor BamB family protein n=1 Tax=Deinococcus sp. KSM4-11 TaxID=2568654 RepID=UPI0010A57D78|nr:PQQ-binding-like beta-propeller repeat protein [Deinococcus sp. KSM4-11]THF86561.1 c-type cytochrome [Deinococcus sp. KSM4-11]